MGKYRLLEVLFIQLRSFFWGVCHVINDDFYFPKLGRGMSDSSLVRKMRITG
ncbi:MAG: hypothetical protein VX154_08540 [Pseudomonadota bacterium]|nr:hypothetical protein [Pseudomonadota bacterium]